MSEEELTKAMEGLGMDDGDGDGNILPIMQSIMQNLLSKDVLYPSLKEITEKVCEFPLLPFLLTSLCQPWATLLRQCIVKGQFECTSAFF